MVRQEKVVSLRSCLEPSGLRANKAVRPSLKVSTVASSVRDLREWANAHQRKEQVSWFIYDHQPCVVSGGILSAFQFVTPTGKTARHEGLYHDRVVINHDHSRISYHP